jgi:HAD superfamily hydrolase (TIGR01490 family)
MKPVVFFDIDDTLIKGSTQRYLIPYLYRKRLLSLSFTIKCIFWFVGYELGLIKKREKVIQWTRGAYRTIKGWDVEEFDKMLDNFCHELLEPRIFQEAKDVIKKHKEDGYEIVLLSGTIDPIAERLGKALGIDICMANRLWHKNGKYTGEVEEEFVYAQGKVDLAKKLAIRYDLDLSNSYAYGDHLSDIPLLELVSNPIAVNPDKKLRIEAKKRNWPIFDWKTIT